MAKKSTYIVLFIFLSSVCAAQPNAGAIDTTRANCENAPSRKAITVATDFMNALIKGASSETLRSHCAVPFCHDDTILVLTNSELKKFFDDLSSASSQSILKNHPRLDSVYVYGVQKGVLHGIIPINIYITVANIKFNIQGQEPSKQLVLAVEMSDTGKIVGMSD